MNRESKYEFMIWNEFMIWSPIVIRIAKASCPNIILKHNRRNLLLLSLLVRDALFQKAFDRRKIQYARNCSDLPERFDLGKRKKQCVEHSL